MAEPKENIQPTTHTGVPGGARVLRPNATLATPLSAREKAKYEAVTGKDPKPSDDGKGGKSSLLVDNDVPLRGILAGVLTGMGFACEQSGGGAQALKRLSEKRFSLLVLELKLPGLDGYELLRGARLHLRLEKLPILVVTALEDVSHEVTSLELGADGFIRKPFNLDQVKAHIGSMLRSRS